jgi:hypothetical protein
MQEAGAAVEVVDDLRKPLLVPAVIGWEPPRRLHGGSEAAGQSGAKGHGMAMIPGQVRRPAGIQAHDRTARSESLGHWLRRAVMDGRQDQNVRPLQGPPDLVSGNMAHQAHAVGDAEAPGKRFHGSAALAVAVDVEAPPR